MTSSAVATGGGGAPQGLTFSGTVTGSAVPATGAVFIIWQVTSGNGDHLYKFGEGSSTSGTFMVALPGDPPDLAINAYGVGVGYVVLFEPEKTVPDGIVALDEISGAQGFAVQYAVIWRDISKSGNSWSNSFPAGLTCGQCVQGSGVSDGYAPVDCSLVEVATPVDESAICNWT